MRDYIKSIVSVARRRCDELHGRPSGAACKRCLVATAVRPRQAHAEAEQYGAAAIARQDAKRRAERVHQARRMRAAGARITYLMGHFGISYATIWTWLYGDPFAQAEKVSAWRRAGERITSIMSSLGVGYATVKAWLSGDSQAKAVTS